MVEVWSYVGPYTIEANGTSRNPVTPPPPSRLGVWRGCEFPTRDNSACCPGGEVDHRDAALAHAGLATDAREPPVGHVQLGGVATGIEPVGAHARLDEA